MPTYDYLCEKCGIFELYQSITADKLRVCSCGSPVKRQIGKGGGIIFRGSGFYCTDYRDGEYKAKEEKENLDGT